MRQIQVFGQALLTGLEVMLGIVGAMVTIALIRVQSHELEVPCNAQVGTFPFRGHMQFYVAETKNAEV